MHRGAEMRHSCCTLSACHAGAAAARPRNHSDPRTPEVAAFTERAVFRQATRVKKLAYTRTQAAQALGISTSTFERRILPFIETIQMDWGKRFIPVDELERFLTARRQQARAELRRPVTPGRKPGLPPEVVARIQQGARTGKEPPPDRAGPQHGPGTDIPGWPTVVALDRARRSRPPESAYGRARGLDSRRLHHRASGASSGSTLPPSQERHAPRLIVSLLPFSICGHSVRPPLPFSFRKAERCRSRRRLRPATRARHQLTAEDDTVYMGAAPNATTVTRYSCPSSASVIESVWPRLVLAV